MIQSRSVQLPQIAQHLPFEAEAAGRIMRIRRWLSNVFVSPVEFYRPLIQQVLSAWDDQTVFLILDSTAVNQSRLQILRLALSHAYRTLPLSWQIIRGAGLVTVERAAALLAEGQRLLHAVGTVTLIADRGFRDTDWAAKCLQLGWNYLIRIANNTTVYLPDGRYLSVADLGVMPGQARYFRNVGLTKDKAYACHLMVTWTDPTPKQPAELCALITNLRPGYQTLQNYLRRMHVEEGFRDDKSGCCQLQKTRLRDADRLNHLLLAYSVVILWVHELGQQTWQSKQRKQIDPAAKRQLSIFQIGWRKLLRAISCGPLPSFTLCIRPMHLAVVRVKNRKC
jgi:Transposase DDE domain